MRAHSPKEIAEVIAPQFKETDLDTITAIVTRYYDQDTWKNNLVFEEESFELLQDILEDSGELKTVFLTKILSQQLLRKRQKIFRVFHSLFL